MLNKPETMWSIYDKADRLDSLRAELVYVAKYWE